MIAAFRVAAFVAGALAVELGRGPGIATVALAALVGFARYSAVWLIVAAGAGAALSLAMPDDVSSSGKVVHALSNAPFVVLLYCLLALAGYAGGRLARALRGR